MSNTEQKLKESEERYRELANSLPQVISEADERGNLTFVNKNAYTVFGYTPDDFNKGLNALQMLIPEDRKRAMENIKKVLRGKKEERMGVNEYTALRKDGSTFPVIIYSSPIIYKDISVGTRSITIDITDKIKAEQKLKESEEKYRLISETAYDLIGVLNKKFKYEYINETAFQQILGYSSEDLLGKSALQFTHPEDISITAKALFDGFEQGKGEAELRFKHKDGHWVWIEAKGRTFFDKDRDSKAIIISRDITRRKQAERELQLERDNFLNILGSMEDGVCIINQQYNIEYANPSLSKEFGQFEGIKCFKYFEDRNDICPRCKNKEIFQGKTVRGEWFSFKNQKTYDLIDTPLKNPDGSISKLTIMRDETDKKQAEVKLKESKEKFRKQNVFLNNILQSLTHPFYVINADDYTVALANFTASSEGLKLGKHCYSLTHNNDKPCEAPCKCPLDEVKKTKRACVVEHTHYDREGKAKIYEIYGYPILDENGNVVQMIEYALNITDRKIAQQSLKNSEEKFRTIAEQTLMGIIIIQDNQIKYVNDALLTMFEYTQLEIVNWEVDDLTKLIYSEDLPFLREYREHLRSGEKSFKSYYSYRVLTKSGKMKWIDQFSKEISYKGMSAELITIMDITEKKEAEHELIKLTNLKSELLRRTSHELKTPLVSIKGFSDLLLELHKDKLDNYVIKTIKQIRIGCNRLESLVNDILKTAELESGTVELKKSKEDLSLLIKICVSELEGLSELRNHTINLEILDNLICSYEKDQIYNVIINILSNAIKYTPYTGKIKVKSEINNNFAIISIKDNGIGFSKEEKTQIFKQFGKIERYGQGYDIISEGSGLGLFISKKIVEMHGGEIWVESEGRNKGSTFYFSLPID